MSKEQIDLTYCLDFIGKIAGQCAGKPYEETQKLLTPLILDVSGKISRAIAAKEKIYGRSCHEFFENVLI